MAKYLTIFDYTSVDQDGCYPVDREEIREFELDDGRNPQQEHHRIVRESTRGKFIDGRVKSRLFRIAEEIRVD